MTNISYKHLIYDHELTLYPYAPIGLLHNQGEWPEPIYRLSIFTIASIKNSNLIKWLTYHQTIGVNHIYLYCIDDDPTELYRQIIPFTLGNEAFVTFHHYRFSELKAQIYLHFAHNYIHETSWYIHLDINDYLYFHEEKKLSDLIDNFTTLNINAICLNIFLFDTKDTDELTLDNTTIKKEYYLNIPCVDTKIMIRGQACPYQYIFHHLDTSIEHYIYTEKLLNHCSNVFQQHMKNYYDSFPHNAWKFIQTIVPTEIIKNAYIAHFCNEDEKQKYIDASIKFDKNNNAVLDDPQKLLSVLLNFYTPEKTWEKLSKNTWQYSFLPIPSALLSIISYDKPCQQSSTSENCTTEQMAKVITNGEIKGVTQTITKSETDPWWEIDLQKDFIVKNIRLFNGIDFNIENMSNFIIESSENHQTWIKRYQKTDTNLVGGSDGSYYNWVHPLGIKTRWIRITVPGENKVFSLDQIQILGMEHKSNYNS